MPMYRTTAINYIRMQISKSEESAMHTYAHALFLFNLHAYVCSVIAHLMLDNLF